MSAHKHIQTLKGHCDVVFGCVPNLISLRLLYNPHYVSFNCQLPSACTPIYSDIWRHNRTHISKNALLCTHIESCVPVSKEGESDRDLHEPGASVVLSDGLGVPLVLAKGVEVLQGHSGFHPRQQVQGEQGAEAGQQGSQHQHHGLSHPGMELTAGTAEGREEHTHLRQQEQSRTGQDRTFLLSTTAVWILPWLLSGSASFSPHLSFSSELGFLCETGEYCRFLAFCLLLGTAWATLRLTEMKRGKKWKRGSSVIQLRCFLFFFFFFWTIQRFGPWWSA